MARLNELVRNEGSPQEGGAGPRPKGESNKATFKNVDTTAAQISLERQAQLVLDADLWHAQAEMELSPILGAIRSGHTFSLGGVTQAVDGFVNSLAQGDRLLVKAISAERGGLVITNLINTTIIADTFGTLLHRRRYRKRSLPNEAVRELLTKEKTSFRPKIWKCLIHHSSLSPLEPNARLTTGSPRKLSS